jgi:hypothetical protein
MSAREHERARESARAYVVCQLSRYIEQIFSSVSKNDAQEKYAICCKYYIHVHAPYACPVNARPANATIISVTYYAPRLDHERAREIVRERPRE